MSVRAKMRLAAIVETWVGPGNAHRRLRFECQYDPEKSPEDIGFTKATPTGHAEFVVDNPEALEQFVVGEYYYVDFSPVLKT